MLLQSEKDFRHILQQKGSGPITIATPEHWHAPMPSPALQAGKHVYVEKPCSHNPAEGVLLVEAQQKYKKHVQLGTQRRSNSWSLRPFKKVHDGVIGRPYFRQRLVRQHKRKSIGTGKVVPFRRNSIGNSGRVLRRAGLIRTIFIPITGTGSSFTAPAKR